MWRTTFAFQPWHSAVEFKRYLVRFAHMVDGFRPPERHHADASTTNTIRWCARLRKWLDERGVVFAMSTTVTDLAIAETAGVKTGRTDRGSARRRERGDCGAARSTASSSRWVR